MTTPTTQEQIADSEMTDDKIGDAFARVYNARDNLREAIKGAIDVLKYRDDSEANAAYRAAIDAEDDLEQMHNLQLLIDTLEEML